MTVGAGQSLLHYRIVEEIGAGGMGVVWKAVDTTLDREVAIKILPDEMSRDPDRLARFEREAKLLALLNHPNIAAVYSVHHSEGLHFLAMEFVAGEDLASRLGRGPLPLDEALEVAGQIAAALEAAHERGVVHRDLKPANVKLAPDGKVKVLDFGLAKSFSPEPSSLDPSLSPTVTSAGSRAGVILGTAAYMSPEQARGKPLDKRTDIWSFGCVLYQFLTGKRPFEGETNSDVLAAILRTDPDWTALPSHTPSNVRDLLVHCFQKDPRHRFRDAGDAWVVLNQAIELAGTRTVDAHAGVGAQPQRRGTVVAALIAVALLGVACGAVLWNWLGPGVDVGSSGHRGVVRFTVNAGKGLTVAEPAITLDGTTLVYQGVPETTGPVEAQPRLYVRRLDEYETRPIRGSEGAHEHALSPDSRWVVFVSGKAGEQRLVKAPLDDSAPPVEIADWKEEWKSVHWSFAGELCIVTGPPIRLLSISANGGPAEELFAIEGGFYRIYPTQLLPDGRHALTLTVAYEERGFTLNAAVLDFDTGELRPLIEDAIPVWSATGHVVFTRHDRLLAAPFDLERLELSSGPVPLMDGLRARSIWMHAWFGLAKNGTLVYTPGGIVGGSRRMAIVDNAGNVEPWSDERRAFADDPHTSHDGSRVAFTLINPRGLNEVWISDLDRPSLRPFIAEQGRDCAAGPWIPDSDRLVYRSSGANGETILYAADVVSGDEPELLLAGKPGDGFFPTSVSRDGTLLVDRDHDVVAVSIDAGPDGTHAVRTFLTNAHSASHSPDGSCVSYVSTKSGQSEVYVRELGTGGEPGREVHVGRGLRGLWSPEVADGQMTLYYATQEAMFEVEVSTKPVLRVSEPRRYPDPGEIARDVLGAVPLSHGRFLVVLRGEDEAEPTEIRVVLNWSEELTRRLAESH